MIILKQIAINDFLSHETTRITLKEGDKLLLDGVSGSGKSSIIDALLWALYGRGRVDNRSLIRKGAKECSVAVTLQDTETGVSYQIIRTATTSGKHTVGVASGTNTFQEIGTGGIRDTDAYIVKLLGASYQLFVNSVVFPQDNAESFVTAESPRRKELLMEILKTADIDEYLQKTRDLLEGKKVDLSMMLGGVEISRKIISSNEEEIKKLPAVKQEIIALEADVVGDKRILADSLADRNAIEAMRAAVAEDLVKLAVLKKQVKDVHEYSTEDIERAKEAIKDEELARGELREAIRNNDQIMSLMTERPTTRNYEAEIESIDRRVKKLVDETLPCPSGDACPYTKMIGPELELLYKERREKVAANEQQTLAAREWEKKMESAGARVDTKPIEDRLAFASWGRKILDSVKEAEEQTVIAAEITALQKSLDGAPTPEEVASASRMVDDLTEVLKTAETLLGEKRGYESYLTNLLAEAKRLHREIADTEAKIRAAKDEIDLLGELKEALGTTGITAVALDYLLPSLEEKVNEILSMLSDFRVELSTQREGATGSKIEGLFISVVNPQGERMDFNSYSGGERVRISVAISEALASLQRVGFRIMDETVQALDEDMVDNFTKVLSTIQSRYSQTICISHLQLVKDLFDKRLTVRKVDGVSQVS